MPESEGSTGSAPARASAAAARWRVAAPGLVIIAIAIAALLNLRGARFGTVQHLGPAFVPDMLAALLLILGVGITLEGLFGRRSGGGE